MPVVCDEEAKAGGWQLQPTEQVPMVDQVKALELFVMAKKEIVPLLLCFSKRSQFFYLVTLPFWKDETWREHKLKSKLQDGILKYNK